MGFLVFLLENGCQPFAHSVVMASSPIDPTASAACMKRVVLLPDVGRHPSRHRLPIHLMDNIVARKTAAERMHLAPREIQRSHHLLHLLQRIVGPDKYQGTALKSTHQQRGAGQNNTLTVNRVKKVSIPALMLAQRIEAGRTEISAQFPNRVIRCKTHR
jgi:hypothetical protein